MPKWAEIWSKRSYISKAHAPDWEDPSILDFFSSRLKNVSFMIISKVHVTNVSTIKLMTTSICVCYDCDKN